MADSKKVLKFNFAASLRPAKDVFCVKVPLHDLCGWLSVHIGLMLSDVECPIAVSDDEHFELSCYLATCLASSMVGK